MLSVLNFSRVMRGICLCNGCEGVDFVNLWDAARFSKDVSSLLNNIHLLHSRGAQFCPLVSTTIALGCGAGRTQISYTKASLFVAVEFICRTNSWMGRRVARHASAPIKHRGFEGICSPPLVNLSCVISPCESSCI